MAGEREAVNEEETVKKQIDTRRQTDEWMDRQADRQLGRQTDRDARRQRKTDEQTDI